MAVAAALAWFEECRETEYLVESIRKKLYSISRRLMEAKDLSEAEAAKLKEERLFLTRQTAQIAGSPKLKPDFSGMTEAERAETAERLRSDELAHARRLAREGDVRALEAFACIVDFDPKQGGLYYPRYNPVGFGIDEESSIGPMRFIDKPHPYKNEENYTWLSTAVNFLSVKFASLDVAFPIRVYGTIIVRDVVGDFKCLYHLRRDSDNCQLISSKDESLTLTGPKRGLELGEAMYVEIDLKMKDDQVQGGELSKGLIRIACTSTGVTATGYKFQTKSLATRLSTVDVDYALVFQALEGAIAVEVLQGGFHGKIVAYTSNMMLKYMLVLYDSFKEADATTVEDRGVLELMRPVVSVSIKDVLVIEAMTSDESARIAFSPRINAREERQLAVGATKLGMKLYWSMM